MKRTLAVFATCVALAPAAYAQKPITQTEGVELKAKIEAIDKDNRFVTLKDKDGDMQTIYAGPEVKRFDELKVGDTVTFRYFESVAVTIRKPGDAGAAPGVSDPAIVRSQGPKPGGTVSQQMTATVTLKAIDPKVPSVTALTDDGRTLSFKVDDKKYLQGVKVGDKVVVTYTQAFMVSVK